ncbi:hypothetical protein SAMN04488543_0477 [Friedmanniella luteola]|uniref:Heparin binding hemagglutinin HbhA n=1 Tax=Friedmanniella luteola TaxID=546871 RepID=A0A1H1LWZ4_9ACTN|nr:hypothetical protein [Friedmanniella luteola]SDR79033.1 hypothetical protein SAMN04488543_0477 [Friedmanniella luteola]
MSTTPDPTPVDPDLSRTWVDPAPVEVPLDAATGPGRGPDGVPLQDEPAPAAAGDPVGAVPPATEQARRGAADATAAMRESDLKALYAAAGATQVLVGALRDTVSETSRWASARLAELRFRRAELAKQAEEMRLRAEGVQEEVKAAPEVAKSRVADLQQQATGTYSDLAARGQRALLDVRSDVVNRIDPAFDRLEERLEAARRAIRGTAAKTPVPPVAEPGVPTPAAPVAESPVPAPGAPLVEDLDVQDAVLVEEVVVEPTPQDPTAER